MNTRRLEERAAPSTPWRPPEADASDLQHRFGHSVLLEFIRGHGPSAVLRELVQNEYDAGGSVLQVMFGDTALEIRGNGTPIDRNGWSRLSVTLGTGVVGGLKNELQEKENGIGSKNFGLRSLFLFGNRVYVRSNGRQTLLDLQRGALEKPLADPSTAGTQGVRIHIPYRTEPAGGLNAFSESVESAVLDDFAEHIAPSLLKLASHGPGKSLPSVTVSSARVSRQIRWKQSVTKLRAPKRGVDLLVRRITKSDSQSGRSQEEELEWQKRFELPEEFRHQRLPGYFRAPRARIRIGLSLRTRRRRLSQANPPGIAYYPIGVPQATTGNRVSISAPFEMDSDRSELVDSRTSAFNEWLLDCAAEMTISLLQTDWFDRFGADAYRAVAEIGQTAVPTYTRAIEARLQNDPCWPVRQDPRQRGRSTRFAALDAVNVVSDPALDHFLRDDQYLHPALNEAPAMRELAIRYGVQEFSLRSLLRLRCAGENPADLQSECEPGDANYYYTDFPEHWRDVDTQRRCAAALDKNRKQLSKHNRADLASSETTLAANLSLAAAEDLWFVPNEISGTCPLPEVERLHPELTGYATLRGLSKRFNVADWIEGVATRAEAGEADEYERVALYQYILSVSGRVPRRTLAVIRRSPVLRDRDGNWASPRFITMPGAAGTGHFRPALNLPHRDYVKDKELAKALRFKNKVTGDDVVRFAEMAAVQPEMAEQLEQALGRSSKLLTPRVVKRLQQIKFIRSNDGGLRCPPSLYLFTRKNQASIGPDGPYPAGGAKRLFARLGCQPRPAAERVAEYLAALRHNRQPPARPDVLYPEFVAALRRESNPRIYDEEDILWTGNGYNAPANTVLGARWDKILLGTVPTISAPSATLQRAFRQLGVCERPEQRHWEQLFVALGERYRAEGSPRSRSERTAMRRAYLKCQDMPSLPSDTPWLLDDSGGLHTTSDARSGRFVIEDDMPLGTELRNVDAPVSFADRDPTITSFFRQHGVKTLSEVQRTTGTRVGQLRDAPSWFSEEEYLGRLRSRDFGSALKAIAGRDFRATASERIQRTIRKLAALERVVFAEEIHADYRVGRTIVAVSANHAWTDKGIYLTWVRSRARLESTLALLIAGECTPDGAARAGFSDSIFRLVNCENASDIQEYLEQRGIRWRPKSSTDDESAADAMRELDEVFRAAVRPRQSLPESMAPRPSVSTVQAEATEEPDSDAEAPFTLPPIDGVKARIARPSGNWSYSPGPPRGRRSGGGGGPRGLRDEERDRAVGRRGEEIVYMLERTRVRSSGYPEERVVWVADSNPSSDFDIESVGEDGERLFIEVKSTSGADGTFHWSLAEFQRALEERDRYVLYRVYKANGGSPIVRPFRNPVSLMARGGLHLDIESFRAQVQPES